MTKKDKPVYKTRKHKVVYGDSLKSLAAKYLGNENRSAEIKAANNLMYDFISEGQVIKIPEK